MKKIEAVVTYFYPVAAGIETNMLETYSRLVQRGWQVTVHTTKNTHIENGVLLPEEVVRGITVKRYVCRWFSYLPQIDWHADVLALHNFNVMPHFLILLVVGLRRIVGLPTPKVMLTPHGGFTPDWQIFSPPVRLFKSVYHFTIGTALINWTVDWMRTVSSWESTQVIAHGIRPEKVFTITNGIETEAYVDLDQKASKEIKLKAKKYGKYLIKIARIYDIKNYETIIKALAQLPTDINFVIVGPISSEAYLQTLQQLITRLQLTNRVFFAGVIRGYDKYYLIKKSLMMVHMARWESFCNAVHEGMSQGKICIVAKNSALLQLITEGVNGYLIDTFDSNALAEKIKYVLDKGHRNEIQKIEQTNLKVTRTQTWENVAIAVQRTLTGI